MYGCGCFPRSAEGPTARGAGGNKSAALFRQHIIEGYSSVRHYSASEFSDSCWAGGKSKLCPGEAMKMGVKGKTDFIPDDRPSTV